MASRSLAYPSAVDLPADADTGAAVTHMCRRLCALRAQLSGGGGGEVAGGDDASLLCRINMILTIADAFFPVGLHAAAADT